MDENMNRRQDQEPPPHRRVMPPENGQNHHHQPPPPQKCPRCYSPNTKFCYYNNYSLSQPRYFCKACRRYWTHGGTLRNVPIGGGCRKSKRPKISAPSSSTTEIGRTQALPAPSHFPGIVSGQGLRSGLDPGMGNNSFYTGGALLSSLAALQSLPAGINQPPAASLAAVGGVGGGRFGSNVALLQGMNLSSSRPQPPQQFNDGFFQSPLRSWTQGFVNRGGATTSAGAGASFWGGAAVDGGDQVGSSFNPNQWSSDGNNHHGYNPSR